MTARKPGPAMDPFDRDCDCVVPTPRTHCRHRVLDPMPDWPTEGWIEKGLRQAEAWAQPIPPEVVRGRRA